MDDPHVEGSSRIGACFSEKESIYLSHVHFSWNMCLLSIADFGNY